MSYHHHIRTGPYSRLERQKFRRSHLFFGPVRLRCARMGIPGGIPVPGEMLQTGADPGRLQPFYCAGHHIRRRLRVVRKGAVPDHRIVRIGQYIRYRGKVHVKPVGRQVGAYGLVCRISRLDVPRASDVRHRPHVFQSQRIRHPGHASALFIHPEENREAGVGNGIGQHLFELFFRLDILFKIDQAAHRPFGQGFLGALSGLDRLSHPGQLLRGHEKQTCHLLLQRHPGHALFHHFIERVFRRIFHGGLFLRALHPQKLLHSGLRFRGLFFHNRLGSRLYGGFLCLPSLPDRTRGSANPHSAACNYRNQHHRRHTVGNQLAASPSFSPVFPV